VGVYAELGGTVVLGRTDDGVGDDGSGSDGGGSGTGAAAVVLLLSAGRRETQGRETVVPDPVTSPPDLPFLHYP